MYYTNLVNADFYFISVQFTAALKVTNQRQGHSNYEL